MEGPEATDTTETTEAMEGAIRFAGVGADRVAYATHGSGELDIVYAPGLASHLDLTLEQPRYRRYIDALSRFGRVIRFDRRGAGVSDPGSGAVEESWEAWADDLAAVLDDARSRRAAVIAANDAGPAAILFAVTQPERVQALVLFNTTARLLAAPDYPEGHPPELAELVVEAVRSTWGTEDSVPLLAPSLAADAPFRRWYARFQRGACSPAMMAQNLERLFRMDGRAALGEVRCPTLVLHREEYGTASPGQGRYLAERIPGARFELVPGADAPIYTQGMDGILASIGELLGSPLGGEEHSQLFNTVLFTDIVDSTKLAVALGDREWQSLLGGHDAAARESVAGADGLLIKTTGDGVLARFDAPSRALRCASEIRDRARGIGIEVRAGLHAGPVTLREDGDISGVAVNVAARVLGNAGPGETLVSGSIVDLLAGSELDFEDRGEHTLKGIPERQRLFAVGTR